MQRREFLAWSTGACTTALWPQFSLADIPRDVAWLADVQRPPQNIPTPERPLAPILVNDQQQPITTREQWEQARKKIREAWLKFLGPMPTERPPVKLEVLKEDRPDGCVRQLVRYLAEADEPVEGYLLRPTAKTTGKRSGIIALHQTSKKNIEEISGVDGLEEHQLGLQLCRDGHVVFCPRCYLWETPQHTIDVKSTVARFKQRHPETLGMHKMLFDAQRAVDVLVSLPDVDPQRIGAVGHSLGSKEAFYVAAFDERIRTAVASEGGIGFASTNWKDPWYLGSGITAADFQLNHHQLLALIAPRPFLILAGEAGNGAADGDRSWPYVAAALPAYRLYGEPARLGLLNHHRGHSIPPEVKMKLLEWLRVYTA
ncbi:MAG: Dienelactone hydrolase [Planctomycetaceae bacterium]|nr:Dienelactone hydrolase [Planctomycetaceae bacterium]